MEIERKHQPRHRRTGGVSKLGLFLSALVILAVLIAACILFFRVNRVEVEGNSHYTAEEIISASGVVEGDNLILAGESGIAARLKSALPYVSSVTIRKSLPDTLVLTVRESTAQAAIYDGLDGWWLIDANGKLLEEVSGSTETSAETEPVESAADASGTQAESAYVEPTTAAPEGYPVITGLVLEAPGAGRTIAVSESASRTRSLMLESLLELLPALQNHSLLQNVNSIDLSGESEILVLYENRLTIRLAQDMDYDYQARLIQTVLDEYVTTEWTETDTGTLDMTFADGNPRLSKNNPA